MHSVGPANLSHTLAHSRSAPIVKVEYKIASSSSRCCCTSPEPYRSQIQTLNERKSRGILKRKAESGVWSNAGLKKPSDALQTGVLQLILPEPMRNQ